MPDSLAKYPLDFDSLKKGDVINSETISSIYSVPVGSDKYKLGMLALQGQIEKELAIRGLLVTVKGFRYELKILTDPEAAIYNQKRFDDEKNALYRVYARKIAVDINNLTPEQKVKHQRELSVQGQYIQALTGVRRMVRSEAHKRQLND